MTMKTTKRRRPASIHAPSTAKLDGRTSRAIAVKRLKRSLTETPKAAAKGLLVDLIARNTVIEKELYTAALNEGLLDDQGKLNPLIERSVLKFQSASKVALIEYLKLGGKEGSDGDDFEDVLEGIFDGDE